MSRDAQIRWDGRYRDASGSADDALEPGPSDHLAAYAELFPESGTALELACGTGRLTAWLGTLGLSVLGVDVSPVAIELAQQHVDSLGLTNRCDLRVHDLDDGLPHGGKVDVVLCHLFRDASLDEAIIDRLNPGGLLAMVCLSEVGHGPGRFRTTPGELVGAFSSLDQLASHEGDGVAVLIAQARTRC